MKEAYWGYFIVGLGIVIIFTMILIQNITTTSEENYYLIKEAMGSAMIDAVDYGAYRLTGEVKISKEKFVESFLRRFSESSSPSKTYNIEFYEIYETPPKATIKISTSTSTQVFTGDATEFDIITTLNGILETKY
jgi:hypothetical protein